jgi:2-polyprenyl-3-methyl-5-hydroxy-6-metoxy-1,4-benzoquinol methylase
VRNCPYCQTPSAVYFRSRDYNRNVTRQTFTHLRCPRCGLIFIASIPANLANYYPDAYHSIPRTSACLEANSRYEFYKVQLVQRFVSKGRLLEIGPSAGTFSYLAKQAGFEVDAIEMSEGCCDFLNRVVGIRAINSSNPVEVLRQSKGYDVIAMWHVIEHLSNPWNLLDAICSVLKPGGIVVLASPNPDAWQFRIMGRYWPHVDAPRHLMLIPMKVLIEKMGAFDMKTILATTTDAGSIGWNSFGWEYVFANLSRQIYIRRALRLVGKVLSICVARFEKQEGKGSAYTLIFKKDG